MIAVRMALQKTWWMLGCHWEAVPMRANMEANNPVRMDEGVRRRHSPLRLGASKLATRSIIEFDSEKALLADELVTPYFTAISRHLSRSGSLPLRASE